MKLYNVAYSGNSYKVRLLLANSVLPCEIIEVDILKGKNSRLDCKGESTTGIYTDELIKKLKTYSFLPHSPQNRVITLG